jgi:transposase InsO family protein
VLFLDVIPNPAKGGLTSKTLFKDYLIIVDAFSRYFISIGLNGMKNGDIIEALKAFSVDHRPHSDYELKDIKEIHTDAGTYVTSESFSKWAGDLNIKVVIAAPEHQEMNGLAERLWQTARVMTFRMLTNARLNILLFHHALMYAWQICVVLPAKSTLRIDKDGTLVPRLHTTYILMEISRM